MQNSAGIFASNYFLRQKRAKLCLFNANFIKLVYNDYYIYHADISE